MRPVRTARSDVIYTGPPGVGDLYCERVLEHCIESVWYLTAADRAAVAAGANIRLRIIGEPIPPVALEVTDEQGVGEDAPDVQLRLEQLQVGRDYGEPT